MHVRSHFWLRHWMASSWEEHKAFWGNILSINLIVRPHRLCGEVGGGVSAARSVLPSSRLGFLGRSFEPCAWHGGPLSLSLRRLGRKSQRSRPNSNWASISQITRRASCFCQAHTLISTRAKLALPYWSLKCICWNAMLKSVFLLNFKYVSLLRVLRQFNLFVVNVYLLM